MKAYLFASLMVLACCSKNANPPPVEPTPPTAEAPAPPPVTEPVVAAAPPAPPEPPKPAVVIPPYTPSADVPEPITAAITAPTRTDKDRALDAGRKPGEVLAFFKIEPGQKVGELFAGPGYTTELIARIVGDGGKVYAQNSKEMMERFARAPINERAAKPEAKAIVVVEQPNEAPFPAEAKNLDAVICVLNYHDYVWQNVDRAKLNKAVFASLKPGGVYGVVDHAAAKGSGLRDVKTLHRIDEDAVKKEILAAGFKIDLESDVLANPSDSRDWSASPGEAGERRGTSDRFTIRFVKPGGKATKPAKPAKSAK